MDSDDNGTVTLEKNHFEALNGSEVDDFGASQDADKITIARKEYDSLKQSSGEYELLRRRLIQAGVTEETLNGMLMKGNDENEAAQNAVSNVFAEHEDPDESTTFMTQSPPLLTQMDHGHQAYTYGTPRTGRILASRPQEYKSSQTHNFQYQETPSYNLHTSGHDHNNNTFDFETEDFSDVRSQGSSYEKYANRTVQLYNLPDGTTHADVCDVVRGGMLLDMYLRNHDHTAIVSFLEQSQAKEFFRHVKRNDLYIRLKRVDIRWHDRHFVLPDRIARNISMGVTRNLVLHKCNPSLTEEVIRNDLEHIHNLVLIKVVFNGSSVLISTNSVHNAMFARTCMMSRGAYKYLKINWACDECAEPLPRRPSPQFDNPPITKKENTPLANRFEPLRIYMEDELETDNEGKEDKIVNADGVDGSARRRQQGGAGVREQEEEVMA
ncbi:hypothetical protein BPOR_1266g00010 [Botrytis porri]|uniref:RRM domain-containing protein n=1 Tax=Botrytis porri TaxID=87229 RepID=A0A4Z1K5M2_9HELO|nr:hypothetical protein BPOR_1266g00010 [Botrytis porri]